MVAGVVAIPATAAIYLARMPYYRTKLQWAEAKAAELEATLLAPLDRIPSANWRAVRSRVAGQARTHVELAKFRRLVERYREAA